ncbi:MAG: DUF6268 family outer membrane beta-barrel protein [Thermonemataceae bacterium]
MLAKIAILFSVEILLVLVCGRNMAQTRSDKVFIFYESSPSTNFRDIEGESNIARNYEVALGAPPIKISPKLKWINTVYSRSVRYNFQDLPAALSSLSSDLYDIQYGSIFLYDFQNPKWSLLASPRLMLRSDFKDNNLGNSLFLSGLVLVNYNPDGQEKLTWSFGVTLTNDFNRNLVIPVAGFIYKDQRFTIEVTYPRVNFLYKPKPAIEWGVTASVIGGIYNTSSLQLPDGSSTSYTRAINVLVGHTFNYLVSERIVLNTCLGYMPVRNYDLMNQDFEAVKSVTTDLNQSVFLRTGLSIRF